MDAAKPSPLIADEISFALPNDGGSWIPNPHYIMELPEPAWARFGRLRAVYEELKAANDSWYKVPAEDRAPMEASAVEQGNKLPRHWVSSTAGMMRVLSWAVQAEIDDITRRLTAKGDVRAADVLLLLTTRCNLTLTEAKSIPRHEAAELLSALSAPSTIAGTIAAAVRMGDRDDSREVWVFGRPKGDVPKRAARFLRVLLKHFPDKRKGEQIENDGRGSNAAAVLKKLSERDADWKAAILLAGAAYGKYGIAPMADDPQLKNRQKGKKSKQFV